MLSRTNEHRSGFTIIEIMIVLAIAGLIMLIVFLAVPALQRASRNTGRKDDIGRISSAINDFVSNDNGNLPGGTTGATWNADCTTIIGTGTAGNYGDAGQLSQYTVPADMSCPAGNGLANSKVGLFNEEQGGLSINAVTGDAIVLDEGAVCPLTASPAPTTTVGSARQAALLYAVEPSNGNWTWDCIQAE